MKIIQIAPYYPPHLGGMESCVREISEKLAKKGHSIEVFASNIGSEEEKPKSIKNLTVRYLKAWDFAHTPLIPSLFFKLTTISKDSVMHVHVSQPLIPEIAWLISKIRKISYIAHVHVDIEPTGKMGFLLPFYKKFFLKRVLRAASKIVVPTRDYAALISKKYVIPEHKIAVIPYGVDLNNFKSISTELHNPIKLLFVGRLAKQKNIPLLINSLKKIIDKNDFNIELHVVGDGEEKNKIALLIKALKLDDKVILHGSLIGNRLYQIYSNSDIFILPSAYESFGIVLIEAMASGLPIVVSDIPAVGNVIENEKTGLLTKLTPEDFSKAIETMITNSELREGLIRNGLKEVKKYDWDKIVSKFECIYKEAAYDNNKK